MHVIHERCCGLDVHKKIVVACLIILLANGQRQKEIRTFGTWNWPRKTDSSNLEINPSLIHCLAQKQSD
jgi:hypothetical protein